MDGRTLELRGHDAAPTKEKDLKSTNGMPKTMYRCASFFFYPNSHADRTSHRILNAERIRAERKGKMKEGETTAEERPLIKKQKRGRSRTSELGGPTHTSHRSSSLYLTKACVPSISAFHLHP